MVNFQTVKAVYRLGKLNTIFERKYAYGNVLEGSKGHRARTRKQRNDKYEIFLV